MKAKKIILLALILVFFSCKKEKPKVKNCTDNSFCTLSKMPLLNQGSMSLPGIIRKLSGIKVYLDPGWCAPVSVTMGMAGLVRETSNVIKFNNEFDKFRNFSKKYTTYSRTKQYGPSIYEVGQDMATDWKHGGTFSHLKTRAISNYVSSILVCCGYQKGFRSGSTYTHTTNQDIIDIFIKRKPFMAVSFGVYEKNDEDIYSRSGGHALVLNGYEDGYLKIYDPWGKIYNVQFSKAKGKGVDGRTEVRHVSGSSGFVKSYSKWSKKVILNGYDYIYVHK